MHDSTSHTDLIEPSLLEEEFTGASESVPRPLPGPSSEEPAARNEEWNFRAMSLYQVLLRTGWIFKTESLIMPAVLDSIGGGAWLRGWLPMLNRFGQSVPPMIAAGHVRSSRLKKNWLIGSTGVMGLMFLLLALLWLYVDRLPGTAMSLAVLLIYAVFFASTGVNQLVVSSLQGKLIPVLRRGELMTFSGVAGSIVAVLCAWFLLRRWMAGENPAFVLIFLFTGILFLIGSVASIFFRESPDNVERADFSWRGLMNDTYVILKHDKPFRMVALTAGLFGMMMTLFPHYQALARTRLDLQMSSLVPWVIAQNLGVALFGVPIGWITDKKGNRLALRIVMLGLCLVPPLAIVLSWIEGVSEHWYLVVFGLLGLTPVTMRTFNNYTLEMTDRSSHPRYLSILSLLMAGPAILASVLVGFLIEWIDFEGAFLIVSFCQFCGFLMTFWLIEPRDGR